MLENIPFYFGAYGDVFNSVENFFLLDTDLAVSELRIASFLLITGIFTGINSPPSGLGYENEDE